MNKKYFSRPISIVTFSLAMLLIFSASFIFFYYYLIPEGSNSTLDPNNTSAQITESASPNNLPEIQTSIQLVPQWENYRLKIEKLATDAPITWDVDGNNEGEYYFALEKGVAHLKGSAKPGENSNIFIFGHSSFYFYKPGNYKQVFRYLDKLEKGDKITITSQEKTFEYQVDSKKTVWPNEVEVTQATPDETLSLMTCVPPGTTLKRLIVTAKRMN